MNPTLILIFLIGISVVVLSRICIFFEQQYGLKYKRPFFLNMTVFPKKLSDKQVYVLKNKFSFYNRLNSKGRSVFRHRVATFINTKTFVGREELTLTDEMKIIIASTAVMLTFGFRNYRIDLIDKIIIYPKVYYTKGILI